VTTQWIDRDMDDHEGEVMLLGERVRQLRKEHGWSQGEFWAKVGTDPGRISRYESGRITPSVEAVVRLADALGVTVDYLVREDAPRRDVDTAALDGLGERLADLAELSDEDRAALLNVLDALVAKSRLKALAGGIG